jgi:hypothetical protein
VRRDQRHRKAHGNLQAGGKFGELEVFNCMNKLFYLNPKYAKAKTGYYFIHSISTFLYFEKSILRVRSS